METQLSNEQMGEQYQATIDHGPGVIESEAQPEAPKAEKPEESGHPHRIWDGKKEAWVEPHRDSQGRFAAVRKSLERDSFEASKRKQEYLQQLAAGAVELRDDMTPDEWAAARNGQLQNRTQNIQAPELPKEKTPAGSQSEANGQQPLSEEEIEHFANHETLMSNIAARMAIDPEMRSSVEALGKAGMARDAMAVLGHALADTERPLEVLLALGKNPEVALMYSRLPLQGMQAAVRALSAQLKQAQVAVIPKPAKPAPPAPVGARAASVAFDVNDDKTDGDTWVKQRWKQVHESRNRA